MYLSRSIDTTPPERVRALRANRLGVDVVVSMCIAPEADAGIYYFASALSSSSAGKALAHKIGAVMGAVPTGRAIPILKNTRSPAVVVAAGAIDEAVVAGIAQGLIDLYAAPDLPNGE